jgi:hypothetical protein
MESIEEVVQPSPEATEIETEPENSGTQLKTISEETPKAIRQSARRKSATPSKAQPSPIITRRNSRETIGKFLIDLIEIS